jgi:RNA polymerase sigma-70 factor (family 1)
MAQSNIESDEFLVLQLKNSDREAFQKLYLKYIDRIYSFVLSICKSSELSKDVCHDIFAKIWIKRNDLNSELSFKSFLYFSSRNHVLNIIKRASRENEIHAEIIAHISMDEHHAVEDVLYLKETNQLLKEAIENLPTKRKEVFQLSREEGLSHSEIAQRLGITKGTVNVQMVKALNSIRKYLSENGYHSPMIALSALVFS